MTMRYAHLSPGYLAAASSKLDGIMPETGKIDCVQTIVRKVVVQAVRQALETTAPSAGVMPPFGAEPSMRSSAFLLPSIPVRCEPFSRLLRDHASMTD